MNKKEQKVLFSAIRWFENRRPAEIPMDNFLIKYGVTCKNVDDFLLCEAISEYLKMR